MRETRWKQKIGRSSATRPRTRSADMLPATPPRSPRATSRSPRTRSPRENPPTSFLPPQDERPPVNLTMRPDLQTVTTSSMGWGASGSPYTALERTFVPPLPNILPPPRISPRGWGIRTPRDGSVGRVSNRWMDCYESPRDKGGDTQRGSPRRDDVRQWLRAKSTKFDLNYKAWTTPEVIFDVVDTDKSGNLSIAELRKFFSNSPMDAEKLEQLFASIDADGSGEISKQEWLQGFFQAGFDGSSIVGQSPEGLGVLLALVNPPKCDAARTCRHLQEPLAPPGRAPLTARRAIRVRARARAGPRPSSSCSTPSGSIRRRTFRWRIGARPSRGSPCCGWRSPRSAGSRCASSSSSGGTCRAAASTRGGWTCRASRSSPRASRSTS